MWDSGEVGRCMLHTACKCEWVLGVGCKKTKIIVCNMGVVKGKHRMYYVENSMRFIAKRKRIIAKHKDVVD